MNSVDLLPLLRSHRIRLWVKNDQLRYSAPKGGITADLLAEIRKNKIELLNLVKNSERFRQAVSLLPVERTGHLRPSFAQERLWFLYHLFPKSPAYNVSIKIRLAGIMDIPALQKSLQALVDRHESLRTCFPKIDDKPVQVIRDDCPVPLVEHNLKNLPKANRETAADKLTEEEILQPFDLTHGPVIRATLLRIADQDHILLITLHHIVTDGWSGGLIHRDLAAFYNSHCSQQVPDLPPLTIHYADFAQWQRQWLAGEVLEDQLRYWRTQLADLAPLEFPTDRPRSPVQTHSGAGYKFRVSKSLTQGLQALSRQAEVTVATTLLAAFQVLLARYTGQTDIAVGSPIANRTRLELENLVGFFVNTLVMRTDLSGDPTFREVLARVHDVALGAYGHQDLPFEQLVAELQPERDFSRNPLFQVLFAFQNVPREAVAFQGLTIRPMGKKITTTRMDLECFVGEEHEELHVTVVYNTDLFDGETITRFGTHFHKVLTEVVRDPAQRLSQISLLDEAERQQLLVAWNATQQEYPKTSGIHQLFEAQVARTPHAVAVVFVETQLTYGELNTRANQLAHYLQKHGIGPESRVGLCVERSVDMVVGLLGILKAGGAYVPLDPEYPADRLRFMLEDTQARVVVTHTALHLRLPQTSASVLCLDRDGGAIAQEPTSNPSRSVTTENVAYVIFTSGSTGTPKGVVLCHRTLTNLIAWQGKARRTPADGTTLQFASLSFDVSCQEIFSTWSAGGRLLVIPEATRKDFYQLLDVLDREGVERVFLPYMALQQLATVAQDHGRRPATLREVITAGEQLKISETIVQLLSQQPDAVLVNQYGPSESHVVTSYALAESPEGWPALPPIGQPIDNTELYVVDAHLEPVPIGARGELYIGGTGHARGYGNRPALTAERFVPHPFSHEPGARLYRSGDHARYRADGNIEFLGRIDHQVKLRGFRIELGEIEGVLAQHPEVQESVALVREEMPGDQRLVAYVVVAGGKGPSVSALRHFLQKKLPDYMIPTVFVMLDALPLTPTGKVDRRALPVPEGSRGNLETGFVPPQTPAEQRMAKIWQEVLGVEQVGIHDNFFELGGHSLLATQVVSRVYQACEVELPLRVFFEKPTVAGLADFLTSAAVAGEAVARPPLVPVSREGRLPLSFAQQRLWLLEQLDPGDTAYSMAAAFRLSGALNLSALEQSLVRLLQRHEVLRTSYAVVNEQPVQVIASGENFSIPVIDLEAHSPDEQESAVRQQIQEEHNRPFDLAQGPLFRVSLLRLASEEHVLLLVLHHSIADGLSMNILYREVATGYEAACHGAAGHWPPLPIQYADYAVWQRQCLQGAALDALLTYWTEQLAEAPPLLALPTDFPRPPLQTHRGTNHSLRLPEPVVSSLRALSQAEGVTMFMTLLAAFVLLLSRHAGQEDMMVGTPVANRPRPELEGMIGLFLNTLVLRTNLSGDPTFRELLRRVRDVCLGAYAHQDLPFERLVEELQPARDLSRTPLFQVFFNFVDVSDMTWTLPGLTVSPLQGTHETTKFDLTLYVFLTGEGATVQWSYNSDLFEANTIGWMADQFQTLLTQILEQVVDHPDQPIAQYSLLTKNSRHLLPDPTIALPSSWSGSLPAKFVQQVQHDLQRTAIIDYQGTCSYQELNACSNQLANYLLGQGIQKHDVVAIYAHRSSALVGAVLGLLKAGAPFMILDPAYPSARLVEMLNIGNPKGFIHLKEAGPLPFGVDAWAATVLCYVSLPSITGCVKGFEDGWGSDSTADPGVNVQPDELAYLTFTSGTTGKPNCVKGTHRPLSHFLNWYTEELGLTRADRVTMFSGLAHDPLLRDLLIPLWVGGTICIPDQEVLASGRVASWMHETGVTVMHLTPALVELLTMSPVAQGAFCDSLRYAVFGGDVLTQAHFNTLKKLAPQATCVNGYGATETPQVMSYYVVPPETVGNWEQVPIGQGIEGVQILVLTPAGQLAGIGELGEIYVRTPYLTFGYVNDEALTSARYLPNPFRDDKDDRLYRTGDLARYRPDGTVEYVGREDGQVKIRGHRIELREIEAVLRQQPAVQEAVVLCREGTPGEKYLVAYVVAVKEHLAPSELRAAIAVQLPEYMLPGVFVLLEAFPLTPNGKIDRKALPAPEAADRTHGTSYVAPRTMLEELLVEVWQEVLQVERIGIHDHFFELGGHSLLATRVIARLRNLLDLDIPLRSLFEYPVIASLSMELDAQLTDIFPDWPKNESETLPNTNS